MLNQQNRLMSYIPQYNIILKEMSRVTCNHHFPFADVLLSVHQFSAFKSTLKVSVVWAISGLGPFFLYNLLKIERERVDCNFKASSLWYGMFRREDFFGFILIKTWMLNIITNLFDYTNAH